VSETILSIALIALGAALVVAVVAIVWQLKSRFGVKQNPFGDADAQTKAPQKAEPRSAASRKKKGALVVAGERYEFDYDGAEEENVKRTLDLIKSSLILLKESKYPDIIASRARECAGLIKRLKRITDLDEIAIGEIVERFEEYADSLAASLR
jgi:hypothetical protein